MYTFMRVINMLCFTFFILKTQISPSVPNWVYEPEIDISLTSCEMIVFYALYMRFLTRGWQQIMCVKHHFRNVSGTRFFVIKFRKAYNYFGVFKNIVHHFLFLPHRELSPTWALSLGELGGNYRSSDSNHRILPNSFR